MFATRTAIIVGTIVLVVAVSLLILYLCRGGSGAEGFEDPNNEMINPEDAEPSSSSGVENSSDVEKLLRSFEKNYKTFQKDDNKLKSIEENGYKTAEQDSVLSDLDEIENRHEMLLDDLGRIRQLETDIQIKFGGANLFEKILEKVIQAEDIINMNIERINALRSIGPVDAGTSTDVVVDSVDAVGADAVADSVDAVGADAVAAFGDKACQDKFAKYKTETEGRLKELRDQLSMMSILLFSTTPSKLAEAVTGTKKSDTKETGSTATHKAAVEPVAQNGGNDPPIADPIIRVPPGPIQATSLDTTDDSDIQANPGANTENAKKDREITSMETHAVPTRHLDCANMHKNYAQTKPPGYNIIPAPMIGFTSMNPSPYEQYPSYAISSRNTLHKQTK